MILINKTTNSTVVINKITNGIVYTTFTTPADSGMIDSMGDAAITDIIEASKAHVLNGQSWLTYTEKQLLIYLSGLPQFAGYELYENDWNHTTRTVRLFVNNTTVLKANKEQNDLNTIITRLADENILAAEKFIFTGDNKTVVYVNNVSAEDAPIVQPYIESGEITINMKPV